ncbi:hypothetical protein F4W70_01535 [Pseudomonas cannabina]|nr:hypothetical protein F4W70_01535 [Pseudomonas cannabina]
MSGTPRRLVLLPVPGSSRTSPLLQKPRYCGQTKRRPVRSHASLGVIHTFEVRRNPGFCPKGVGANRATLRLFAKAMFQAIKYL